MYYWFFLKIEVKNGKSRLPNQIINHLTRPNGSETEETWKINIHLGQWCPQWTATYSSARSKRVPANPQLKAVKMPG